MRTLNKSPPCVSAARDGSRHATQILGRQHAHNATEASHQLVQTLDRIGRDGVIGGRAHEQDQHAKPMIRSDGRERAGELLCGLGFWQSAVADDDQETRSPPASAPPPSPSRPRGRALPPSRFRSPADWDRPAAIERVQRLARGGAREGKNLRRRPRKQDGIESLCGRKASSGPAPRRAGWTCRRCRRCGSDR